MRFFIILISSIFVLGCAHQPFDKNLSGPVAAKSKRVKSPARVVVRTNPRHPSDEAPAKVSERMYCSGERCFVRYSRPILRPARDPLPEVGGSPAPPIKGVVRVYFSTNRKIKDGAPLTVSQITYERSTSPTFGLLDVSIPGIHRLGLVERPQMRFFGLIQESEGANKHFMVQSISTLTREAFVSQLKGSDSVMVFVHGYNVSFQDAAFRAAQIAWDVHYKGRVVIFSWPSKAGMLKYDYDRESALLSSDYLFDLLKLVTQETDAKKVVVIAHSLGSEVTIGALQQAALTGTKLGLSELIFAASDVSGDLYKQRAEQIKASAEKVTLYASSKDWALRVSIGKSGSTNRMGYVRDGVGPVLVDGVETIDMSAVGAYMFDLNHSTFATSRAVIDDVGRIITTGGHPPRSRMPTLDAMPTEDATTWWRYPVSGED